MKTVYIISYNNWWERRIGLYAKWFREHDFNVIYVTSDFNHFTKKKIDQETLPSNTIFVHVIGYRKNLSIARILSHWMFSIKVFKILYKNDPNAVFGVLPCNSLGFVLWLYKKINESICLLIDITDMWPESLPVAKTLKLVLYPFLLFWRWLRNRALLAADRVICECNLFAQMIKNIKLENKPVVIYLSSEEKAEITDIALDKSVLKIAYLGSINHIIDIDGIVNLLQKLQTRRLVELHIVGGGISCGYFIKRVKDVGVSVHWHGMIFNRKKRRDILRNCHYGLNMMKTSVLVGLTTKSIDYVSAGLPLLNNIKGDTYDLVKRYGIGFNLEDKLSDRDVESIAFATDIDYNRMRQNAVKVFNENFYCVSVENKINSVMMEIFG